MESLILTGLNIIEDDYPVEVIEDTVKKAIGTLTYVVNKEESQEWTGDGERKLDDDCCAEILAAVAVFRKKEMQLGDVKNERMRIFDTVLLSGYRSHTRSDTMVYSFTYPMGDTDVKCRISGYNCDEPCVYDAFVPVARHLAERTWVKHVDICLNSKEYFQCSLIPGAAYLEMAYHFYGAPLGMLEELVDALVNAVRIEEEGEIDDKFGIWLFEHGWEYDLERKKLGYPKYRLSWEEMRAFKDLRDLGLLDDLPDHIRYATGTYIFHVDPVARVVETYPFRNLVYDEVTRGSLARMLYRQLYPLIEKQLTHRGNILVPVTALHKEMMDYADEAIREAFGE